jgi:hypothetical protein
MNRASRQAGQSTVELVVGLIVIIPVVLVLFDLGVIVLGVTTNATVCRDAARAAAAGAPGQLKAGDNRVVTNTQPPYRRADAVVRRMNQSGGAVRIQPDMKVVETVRDPVPAEPYGGPVDGEVTVETVAMVYPPFLVQAVVGQGGIPFHTSQTFPYTWVMPSSTGQPAGGAGGSGGSGTLPEP